MRPFTDDRREALRAAVRALGPSLPRHGRAAEPRLVVGQLAEAGLLRHAVPAAFGGAAPHLEPLSLVVVREELAFASALADAFFAVQGLGAYPLVLAGQEAVRARWLPAVARGEAIAAFALTEPEAGSDLGGITTTARRDGEGYVLDGQKVFVSNGDLADFLVVLAKTEAGPTAFLVPAGPGVETRPVEVLGAHRVAQVRLRGVRLPDEARLGEEGAGLALCLATLEVFRATVGAAACGLAARALDEAQRRVSVRRQFGVRLAEQQSVRFALAEMATELEAARLLVYRAAYLKEQALAGGPGGRTDKEASMAKLKATEVAQTVVDRALQLHGAAGLVEGGVMEALYREVRALRIYEGTSEIQKLVIARALLG